MSWLEDNAPYLGTAVPGDRMKVYRVGELVVKADENGERPTGSAPQNFGFFLKDRDLAEAWATFKNMNVTEDTITDVDTINYLNGPRARQDTLEYFLRVGLFDDDATKRAKDAARPYLITREHVLAGRVKV